MFTFISELIKYRELLLTWTVREIQVRYKQSFFGIAWAIFQPFSMMVVFTIIFGYFVKVPTGDIPYPVFSYTALLPWSFFAASITAASLSLINNIGLITKVYFPREILPLATIGAAFLDYIIGLVLLLLLLFFFKQPIYLTMLILPLILLVQILFTAAISLFISAIIVIFRDIRFTIPLLLQLWMYASPVVYPINLVPEWLQPYYLLNPMAVFIDSYRRITLEGSVPQWNYLGYATLLSIFLFWLGYKYFTSREAIFADII